MLRFGRKTSAIISMPNNEMYEASYNLSGNIMFVGENVQVAAGYRRIRRHCLGYHPTDVTQEDKYLLEQLTIGDSYTQDNKS